MMLLEWMLQATLLGALFGAAALLLERAALRRRRFVWVAALLSSVAVPLVAVLAPSAWPEWLSWRVVPAVPAWPQPITLSATTTTTARGSDPLEVVRVGWIVLSVLCATRYAAGWLRLWLLSRGCARARVGGVDVLLSERLGPAVIGVWRSRVVAPRWLVTLSRAQQRMIVLHEAEHRRAGDHWLIAVAPLVAIMLPWNVMLWWQLRRLRLAIELDCDARVLARGVSPLEYGGLLLDVASSTTGAVVPALAERRWSLEHRLAAIARRRRRPTRARRLALASAAVAAAVTGCLVSAPARVTTTSSPTTTPASEPSPREHVASSPATIGATTRETPQVGVASPARKSGSGSASGTTRGAGVAVNGSPRARVAVPLGVPVDAAAEAVAQQRAGAETSLEEPTPAGAGSADTRPLIIIDGVVVNGRTLSGVGVEPADIERIEVIKGPAAAALYGARGSNGVVAITTRRGGAGR